MDAPTLQWLKANIHDDDVAALNVLEVGSMDVNGSIRPHIMASQPHTYIGLDIEAGPGVDVVANVHDLSKHYQAGTVDVIVSTEALEHIQEWRDAINQFKTALKPGGLLILTTRRPGFPLHNYPADHWRFTVNNLLGAFDDFWVVKCEAVAGQGVVLKARKPYSWEFPTSLQHINPKPAPRSPQRWSVHQAWKLWAYRGRNPSAMR